MIQSHIIIILILFQLLIYFKNKIIYNGNIIYTCDMKDVPEEAWL